MHRRPGERQKLPPEAKCKRAASVKVRGPFLLRRRCASERPRMETIRLAHPARRRAAPPRWAGRWRRDPSSAGSWTVRRTRRWRRDALPCSAGPAHPPLPAACVRSKTRGSDPARRTPSHLPRLCGIARNRCRARCLCVRAAAAGFPAPASLGGALQDSTKCLERAMPRPRAYRRNRQPKTGKPAGWERLGFSSGLAEAHG